MRISPHVADAAFGQSGAGVHATLSRAKGDEWITLSAAETDEAGRIPAWEQIPLETGMYRIVLDSRRYFSGLGATTPYPEVVIIFRADIEYATLQIQVTLSPYSYTTYLGQIRTG